MQLNINTKNNNNLATWSDERSSEQLKAFIHGKMTDVDFSDLDFNFDI